MSVHCTVIGAAFDKGEKGSGVSLLCLVACVDRTLCVGTVVDRTQSVPSPHRRSLSWQYSLMPVLPSDQLQALDKKPSYRVLAPEDPLRAREKNIMED